MGGRMTLQLRDVGGARAKRLFDALLAAGGDVVPTARLAALLWGRALPRDPGRALAALVAVVGHRIDPAASVIVRDGDGYRFDPSAATSAAVDLDHAAATG